MIDATTAWDDEDDPRGNIQHIAEHGITVEEVEEALGDPEGLRDYSGSTGRPTWFGRTRAGRPLMIVYEILDFDAWVIYVVTAYEPTSMED